MDYEKERGKIDFLLLLAVLLITIFGLYIVLSATYYQNILKTANDPFITVKREFKFVLLGIAFMIAFMEIPLRFFKKPVLHYKRKMPILTFLKGNINFITFFMIIAVILVVLTPFVGVELNASRRAIKIPLINIKIAPADVVKFASILFFAKLFSNIRKNKTAYINVWVSTLIFGGITAFFILKQPNLSTTLVYCAIVGLMFFASDVKKTHLLLAIIILTPLILGYALANTEHIQSRLNTFVEKNDKKGEKVEKEFSLIGTKAQSTQAFLSIAEGNLFGVGIGKAYQSKYAMSYPERDFAFATIVEVTGFFGAVVLLSMYLFVIYRTIRIGIMSCNKELALICVGVAAMIFVQTTVHVAVNVGLFPVTGVNLPFISAGGTFKVVMIASMGIVLNISKQTR